MDTQRREVPVLLLTGYLGSGKTTLVNRILTNRRGIRFAVIVNDIGEVNIDANLIARGGVVDTKDDSLVALQNGCICCTLKMDLVDQITDLIAQQKFDYIVIEASGICEPEPIARTICSIPQMGGQYTQYGIPRLDCIVTVTDALRLQSEFACGEQLRRPDIDDEDIENLIIQQIEFCNIVLLNKVSEVTESESNRIREIIHALQPDAEIIGCDYGDFDLDKILDTRMFNYGRVAGSATWIQELEKHHDDDDDDDDDDDHHGHEHHHGHDDDEHEHDHHHHHHHHHEHENDEEGEAEEYGIGTFVYYRRKPFDLNKFDYFCDRRWPKSVIRSKGICYFKENTDMSYLFEQAGVQKKVTEAGQW
ncbi:MAG: GTP-binding protein, partial [Candidatus Amulumruptor sp.]|nr:GTP-binding protein [Candidatus Amulumruptor sp.]